MNAFVTRFRTLWARRKRSDVELTPGQQVLLLALSRSGALTFSRLAAELRAARSFVDEGEATNALLALQSGDVIERVAQPGVSQANRPYRLTKRGRAITRLLPPEPRSTMVVH